MNPSSKRGFHKLLVLFMVLPSLLLRILGLGRNPNKTLGLETTNNHTIAWKTIQSFKSPCSSIQNHIVPYLSLALLLFSSSSLPLPLLLSFPLLPFFSTFFVSQNETKFALIHVLLRPCLAKSIKTFFFLSFSNCILVPNFSSISIPSFLYLP